MDCISISNVGIHVCDIYVSVVSILVIFIYASCVVITVANCDTVVTIYVQCV